MSTMRYEHTNLANIFAKLSNTSNMAFMPQLGFILTQRR